MSQKLCECGCGQPVKSKGSRFCRGHGQTPEMRRANSERMKANNPMHKPDVVARAVANRPTTNPKTSETRKRLFREGKLTPNKAGKAARKRFSERMTNDNPMKNPDVVAKVKATQEGNGAREQISERLRLRWKDPEYRALHVERMKKNNPMRRVEVLEKSLRGPRLHHVATKMEKWFAELVTQHNLPIWFSGLNEYWVSGRNPDFKVHDRKLVIEITDGYTFRKQARNHENYSLPTIAHYEAHGHACLVVMMPERRHKWTDALQASLMEAVRTFLVTGKSAIWSFNE